MKKLNIVCLLFVFAFGIQEAYSQCCCGTISFSMVDKEKKAILNDRLKIEGITTFSADTLFYERGKATANLTRLAMHCTTGGIVAVRYKGATMRLNFKFGMDESADGEIVFRKGDFIAEPIKQESSKWGTGIVVRKAGSDEMKQ